MGLIVGQLLLPNGEPMQRARVHFDALRTGAVPQGASAAVETDEQGRYQQDILPGDYRLSLSYLPPGGPLVRRRMLGDVAVTDESATINQLLNGSVPEYPIWLDLDFAGQRYETMNARVSLADILTFTRASGGGRFNAQGQYEWLPADTPRIDYDPLTGECKGL